MTAYDERDKQIADAIRNEIAKRQMDLVLGGWPEGSADWAIIRCRIMGLRDALAFVDPAPHRYR